jgi:hypothetical protein
MHFGTKSYLKSNHNHTAKHYLVCLVFVYSSYSSTSLNCSGVLELINFNKNQMTPSFPQAKS